MLDALQAVIATGEPHILHMEGGMANTMATQAVESAWRARRTRTRLIAPVYMRADAASLSADRAT